MLKIETNPPILSIKQLRDWLNEEEEKWNNFTHNIEYIGNFEDQVVRIPVFSLIWNSLKNDYLFEFRGYGSPSILYEDRTGLGFMLDYEI